MGNHVYFVSDLHLGVPDPAKSLERERHFVKWLEEISADVATLVLLGDIFDFWFEYKHAVPKGYVRMLGKLAELSDKGVEILLFTGNHDLWYRDYFPHQIGAQVFEKPIVREFFGQKFYMAHGDGLGPGDHGYKLLKKVFTHPLSQWMFARLHPNFGIGLANYFSRLSSKHNRQHEVIDHGENEYLVTHAREVLQTQSDIQYFVFGHRHLFKEAALSSEATLFILGDWITFFSYLKVSESEVTLNKYPLAVPA